MDVVAKSGDAMRCDAMRRSGRVREGRNEQKKVRQAQWVKPNARAADRKSHAGR